MKVYIYALKDSAGDIRYIGKTVNIKRRLSSHISESKNTKSKRHVHHWITSMLKQEKKPTIEIVEECTKESWQEREKYWISFYRQQDCNLCNHCDGGLGGTGCKRNYSDKELTRRKETMSDTMSKFPANVKEHIWTLIQDGSSLKDIQNVYPEYSRQMDFGIRNGRQWNSITKIPKQKSNSRKKYSYQRGLYFVRRIVDGKVQRVFSSKNEQEVIDFLETDR